jgi:uncharacterized membrane protein YccC
VRVIRRAARVRAAEIFRPAPDSGPAVLAGLINGAAIAAPIVVGLAAGDPEAGSLATLGSYLAAFTTKGGARGPRTRGLLVAAAVNAAVYQFGTSVEALFPLALVILIVLVFLASMGSTFGATVGRLGTMPATALLAGTAEISGPGPRVLPGALLFLVGGIWYALATAVLTPAPRLKDVLAPVAQPYRVIARSVAALVGPSSEAVRPQAANVLAKAEKTVDALRGPRGDERLADLTDPLVHRAAALVDLTAALAAAGPPPASIAVPYGNLAARASRSLSDLADHLTGAPATTVRGEADALVALNDACDRLRAETAAGARSYPDMARAARQRRLLGRLIDTIDAAREDAEVLPSLAATRLHPPPAEPTPKPTDAARLRAAMRLESAKFRHALRTTAVIAAVFILVHFAGLPHGSWAALAVLRVMRPQYAVTRERVVQRVAGNLIGGTGAALLIAVVHEQSAIAVVLFAIITAGFTLRPVNYGFWVVFGTPLVLLIGDVSHPGDWGDALIRIGLTVLGTTAALLGGRLLWPSWEHARLADDVGKAGQATAEYLAAVLGSVSRPEPDAGLRRARTSAEKAVAQAETTAAHAQREPGHNSTAIAEAAVDIDALNALVQLAAALVAHSGPQTAGIPAIPAYAQQAAPALTSEDAEDTAERIDVLTVALEQMSAYLEQLHTRRGHELAVGRTGETPARAAVRAHEPVIGLLDAIAAKIREIRRSPIPGEP